MTPYKKYLYSKSWLERASLIQFYHMYKMIKYKYKWNMRKTAAYFQISVGAVSEGLLIANNKNKVSHCKTRKEALELLKK